MQHFASLISQLPPSHQVALAALTCDKMLPSIKCFDELEAVKGENLFKEAIAALYVFSVGRPLSLTAYGHLADRLNDFWPDLDESTNLYASYAFDACVALSEALAYVLSQDTTHVLQCLTAATDTVDMYAQDLENPDLPQEDLSKYIDATPVMQREQQRQGQLIQLLLETPLLDAGFLSQIQQLNGPEPLVELAALRL
jgi:uncharacterized protein YjaG (DUF416 family)